MQLRIDSEMILVGGVRITYDPESGLAEIKTTFGDCEVEMDLLIQSLKSLKFVSDNAKRREP